MFQYGEKLVLLSQAASPVIAVLPVLPPSEKSPYTGAQATGAARASLQRALDNYKTGHINLPPQVAGSDLGRSDTRSFGESHANELSSMASGSSDVSTAIHPSIPMTPPLEASKEQVQVPENTFAPPTSAPPSSFPSHLSSHSAAAPKSQSPPIDPTHLNLSPAPIPASSPESTPSSTAPISIPNPEKAVTNLPPITPTVAETGLPVSAGAGGPGPASGSLHDIKAASSDAGPRSGGQPGDGTSNSFGVPSTAKFESAEEEKKRLAAEYSQAYGSVPPKNETAEEEKARLERERLQRAPSTSRQTDAGRDEEDLPAYQDMI